MTAPPEVFDEVELPPRQPSVTTMAVAATDPPPRMDHHDRSKIRTAAYRALKVYPGPIGDLISRELLAHEELGYMAPNGLSARLINAVLNTPLPVPNQGLAA